eukprot:scaffold6061_cov156-Amphora_coffeaeformis.AAC.2
MKFCTVSILVALVASNGGDAFVAPPKVPFSVSKTSASSLKFAPKGVVTTDKTSKSSAEFNPFKIDTELAVATLEPDTGKKEQEVWNKFANWITSTENRLYIGWFGTLMFPTLLAAATCFVAGMIAAPPGK